MVFFFIKGEIKIDKEKVYDLFQHQLRVKAHMPGFKKETANSVVRHVSLFKKRGFISFSNLTSETAEETVKQELDYFSKRKQQFEWKVYSYDKPENLREILTKHGFVCEEPEALMVMDMDEDDHLLFQKRKTHLYELTKQSEIEEIIKLEETIWQESYTELGERLWWDKRMYPESLFLYGVYEAGVLVSTAWMYLENGSAFASLWGGSTLSAYRNRGYYTDLLAVRAQKAYEKGFKYLTVDASPMSQPILEKAGFECLAYSWGCQSPVNP